MLATTVGVTLVWVGQWKGRVVSRPSGYRVERMSRARLALAAGQESARHKHIMYGLVEADVTVPRKLIRDHAERTGEKLSFAAYVTVCVAAAVREVPQVNAFRRGHSLAYLDE